MCASPICCIDACLLTWSLGLEDPPHQKGYLSVQSRSGRGSQNEGAYLFLRTTPPPYKRVTSSPEDVLIHAAAVQGPSSIMRQRLAPALLTLLWLLTLHGSAHGSVRVPTIGVKLCGREFIRAVIFTCGGSRWRRNDAMQTGDLADLFGNLGPTDINSDEEEVFTEWASNLRPHSGDILDYGSPQTWRDPTGSRHGVPEDPVRAVERRGREAALGLSNTCCKWGCSKSQISSLC
ncbi:relaxin-3 [Dendrobates tinctorius]|uniref:relaxin-3 n=1 Tax=Dendrobates tinctorius TaxID=92724 RepID=UPI003CCA6965